MMRLCIDTNIYSAFKRGNSEVISLLEEADEVLVPVVVLGELYAGFFQGMNQKKNLVELNEFLHIPGISIIEINNSIAERYGNIVKTLRQQGTPIPTNDVWIASAAIEKNARLLSYDRHFESVPGSMLITIFL